MAVINQFRKGNWQNAPLWIGLLLATHGLETSQPCFCYFQVTYSKEGEDAEEQPLRDKLMSSVDSEVLAYDNYQSYNDAVFGLNPEPPRALPSSEGQETRVYILG